MLKFTHETLAQRVIFGTGGAAANLEAETSGWVLTPSC